MLVVRWCFETSYGLLDYTSGN